MSFKCGGDDCKLKVAEMTCQLKVAEMTCQLKVAEITSQQPEMTSSPGQKAGHAARHRN